MPDPDKQTPHGLKGSSDCQDATGWDWILAIAFVWLLIGATVAAIYFLYRVLQ